MHKNLLPAILCSVVAPLAAQNYVAIPATANVASELPNYSLVPFMQPNARVQVFYDSAELGGQPFVADQLSLRFDGPIPPVGAPGPFSITRLQIRVGVTGIAAPGPQFVANLTQPLTTVFDGPVSYLPDNGSASPHVWGGTNDTLTFGFLAPTVVALNPDEWLVVELVMEGNDIASFGYSHAILDGANTSGGLSGGSATSFGQGCSITTGAPAATCTVSGAYGPGGVHFLRGQGLGANTIAIGLYGLTGYLPGITLPGTNCDVFVSLDMMTPTLTNAAGAVTGSQLPLVVPADPVFSGYTIYEQLAALVPGANAFDLVVSNAQSVTLGNWNPLGRGTYMVAHDLDANAAFANITKPFGFAIRFRTL